MAAVWVWGVLLLGGPLVALAEQTDTHRWPVALFETVSRDRMLADVTRLSSETFNGRQAGTPDDLASGLYVVKGFQSAGLQPAGTPQAYQDAPGQDAPGHSDVSPWMMSGPTTAIRIENGLRLELIVDRPIEAKPGPDYVPILDSPSVNARAPVMFVGYGISDPARGFDEYEGLDVRNHIVLFLRGKPERFPVRVSHAEKERLAREKGALAFLTATGPVRSAYEARRGIPAGPLAYFGSPGSQDRDSLPGAWISTALAERILASQGHSLRAMQEQLNKKLTPQSTETKAVARLTWKSSRAVGVLHNVIGLLPGEDHSVHDKTIIIGAHRDHFGRQAGLLFPGADDNASGTAVLLEVARVLAQSGVKPKHSILFVSFSSEEQGLLGSLLSAGRPARPLNSTVAMINVDHAGIGNGRLTVGVNGLPKETAAEAGRLAGLADQLDVYGYFPGGDHVPFKEAGVPTIAIVSSGPHPHFHQPSDRAETIKPEILATVARYVVALLWMLAYTPSNA